MSLIERITLALAGEPPHGLLPGDLVEGHDGETRQAAVLVAITDRPEPGLILTQRRDDLRTHAGQVAFPGGRIDEGEDAPAAALREAYEELALNPALVHLLGEADPYCTVTGYWRDAGRRRRPAGHGPHPKSRGSRRLVRGAA